VNLVRSRIIGRTLLTFLSVLSDASRVPTWYSTVLYRQVGRPNCQFASQTEKKGTYSFPLSLQCTYCFAFVGSGSRFRPHAFHRQKMYLNASSTESNLSSDVAERRGTTLLRTVARLQSGPPRRPCKVCACGAARRGRWAAQLRDGPAAAVMRRVPPGPRGTTRDHSATAADDSTASPSANSGRWGRHPTTGGPPAVIAVTHARGFPTGRRRALLL